jgi:hypothetical protein
MSGRFDQSEASLPRVGKQRAADDHHDAATVISFSSDDSGRVVFQKLLKHVTNIATVH